MGFLSVDYLLLRNFGPNGTIFMIVYVLTTLKFPIILDESFSCTYAYV